MIKLFAILCVITLCAGITSCGGDDTTTIVGNEGGSGSIIGTVAIVDVKKAGLLSTLISDDAKYNITDLTVKGDINGDDISFIREMAGADVNGDETKGHLSKLSMKDANIVAGGKPYYVETTTSAYYSRTNVLTSCMFSKCNKLSSVIFPDNVTMIEEAIFSHYDYKLEEWKGNPNVTSIIMGDKVTSIYDRAFAGTGIKNIDIPNSVTKMGTKVFSGCSNLNTINLPSSITDIGSIYSGCTGITHITIPSGTTIIAYGAFEGCEALKDITIPDNVIGIREGAFKGCKSLVSVSIGKGLCYIGDSSGGFSGGFTFWGCNSLMKFTVSEDNPNFASVDGILLSKNKSQLMAYPHAKPINIPSSVTSINGRHYYNNEMYCISPFSRSPLTSVTIPNNIDGIIGAFNFCSQLTEVHIKCTTPPSLRTIEDARSSSFFFLNEKCILYVPKGTLTAYNESDWKSMFNNIVEE